MNEELVCLLLICYNGSKFLPKSLDAILNQTYKHLKIIYVNDGSTDNSLEVLESYIPIFKKNNMEYVIVSQENKGQAAAINAGLKYISGKYFAWADCDDYYDSVWAAAHTGRKRIWEGTESGTECLTVRGNTVRR